MLKSKRKLFSGLVSGVLILVFSTVALAEGGYMDLQMGPRPQAMGGAFVAVADDVNSGYWNPAGICQLKEPVIGFMHTNPFNVGQVSLDYLAFVHPTAIPFIKGGVGLSYQKISAELEEMGQYTNNWADSMYTLSVAGKLLDRLFYGVNFKSINIETSVGERTSGEALDAGLLYKFNERYSLGLMMRNLSGRLSNESLSAEKRIGVAGKFMNKKLLVAVDASYKKEVNGQKDAWQFHYGAELQVTDNIFLRFGSDRNNFTGGIGIKFSMGGLMKGACLDYSYATDEELNYTHRFALALQLGGVK